MAPARSWPPYVRASWRQSHRRPSRRRLSSPQDLLHICGRRRTTSRRGPLRPSVFTSAMERRAIARAAISTPIRSASTDTGKGPPSRKSRGAAYRVLTFTGRRSRRDAASGPQACSTHSAKNCTASWRPLARLTNASADAYGAAPSRAGRFALARLAMMFSPSISAEKAMAA